MEPSRVILVCVSLVLSACFSKPLTATTELNFLDVQGQEVTIDTEKAERLKEAVDSHLNLFNEKEGLSDTHYRIKIFLPENWKDTYLIQLVYGGMNVQGLYFPNSDEIWVVGDTGDSAGALYHELFHKKLHDSLGDSDRQHANPHWSEIDAQGRALREILKLRGGPRTGVMR